MPLRAPRGFIDETDPKVCQIGHPAPAWLVNYADLMTELVCFFVILYALSASLNKNVQQAKKDVDEMIKKGEMKGDVKVDKEGLKISLEEQGKVDNRAIEQHARMQVGPVAQSHRIAIACSLFGRSWHTSLPALGG